MHDKTMNNVALAVKYFLLQCACCAPKSCRWSFNFRNMRKLSFCLPSGWFISTTSSHLTPAKEPQLRTGSGCELTFLIGSKFTVFKKKKKKRLSQVHRLQSFLENKIKPLKPSLYTSQTKRCVLVSFCIVQYVPSICFFSHQVAGIAVKLRTQIVGKAL